MPGGFTLLEVLVALIVLSIGLIGLAGMQGGSLRFNNDAYLRSQATALAYDMADRVRTNMEAQADYDTNLGPTPTEVAACETVAGCDPDEMAQHDMFLWIEAIADLLPSGTGSICIDSTPATLACDASGDLYVIRVTWDGDRDGSPDLNDPRENVVVTFLP